MLTSFRLSCEVIFHLINPGAASSHRPVEPRRPPRCRFKARDRFLATMDAS
ncbi:hypothetical protein E2C01_085413 [Portunus trituberculatus]|uniref:Uncharacterized protein n=1 Tax=Portunus trituberculatus TaxID=210409 RepID=A0A5B7J6R9_PORTR|nr:hypothetical protein [Portunus trituberculatus]